MPRKKTNLNNTCSREARRKRVQRASQVKPQQRVTGSNSGLIENAEKAETMGSLFNERNSGLNEEFVCISGINEEVDYNEKLFQVKHSPVKDWRSVCWNCFYCSKGFSDFADLKAHGESHHQILYWSETYLKCFDCKDAFLGYTLFLNHIRRCHYQTLKLCCDVCNEVLLDYEQLSIHRDWHNEIGEQIHPNVYHCILCEEVHSTEKLLKSHIQEAHNFITTKKTNETTLVSQTKNKEEHYEIFEYLEDGSDPTEWIKCEDEYGETEQLFQCRLCVQNFTSPSDLQLHIHSHATENSYKCEICGRQLSSGLFLKHHMKIHNNERPFMCNICSKKFTMERILKRHIKNHSNIRPFKCDTCSMEFKSKSHLKKHKLLHTDERPFQCELCPKAYGIKNSLRQHILRTHKTK